MAQSAHSTGFRPYMNMAPSGAAIPMWNGLLASNQLVSVSGGRGDILYATAGYVTMTETTDKLPVGVAANGQATSTGTHVSMLFYPAAPWIVYSGQFGGTANATLPWSAHSWTGTTGKQEISDDAGSKSVWIIGKEPNSSYGAYTDLLFVFNQSKFVGIELDSSNTLAG